MLTVSFHFLEKMKSKTQKSQKLHQKLPLTQLVGTEHKSAVLRFTSQGGHVCFGRCCDSVCQCQCVMLIPSFEINEKHRFYNKHYPSILMTLLGRPSILVGN